jgi:hypothetical protein
MYPAFMYPCPAEIIQVPVYVEGPTTYVGGGLPLGMKLAKIISIKTEFINITRNKEEKNISINLGDAYVVQSKRSKYSKI